MTYLLALIAAAAASQAEKPAPEPMVVIRTADLAQAEKTLAAARDLLIASGFDENLERTMMQMGEANFVSTVAALEQQRGFEMPVELKNRMRLILRNHLAELVVAIRPTALEDAAKIYARYFTAEELSELHKLQTMPVMVKFQRILPDVAAELSTIGAAEAALRMGAVQEEIQAEILRWIEEQGIATPPPASS